MPMTPGTALPPATAPAIDFSTVLPIAAVVGVAAIAYTVYRREHRYASRAAATSAYNVRLSQERVKFDRAAAKARTKADRSRERAGGLRDQADHARTKTRKTELEAKAETAEKRADHLDDLARKLEGGEMTGAELRELMAAGTLKLKKNPLEEILGGSTPAGGSLLEKAKRISADFHEGAENEVIHLAPEDRQLPEYVVALGEVPEIKYEPDQHSGKKDTIWTHESGDRGDGEPRAHTKPWLAIDPRNGRPILVNLNSPMKLDLADAHRGLIG